MNQAIIALFMGKLLIRFQQCNVRKINKLYMMHHFYCVFLDKENEIEYDNTNF
jgi:hypothetical protein